MDEEDYIEGTWDQIILCVEPNIYSALWFAKDLIIANVILRLIIQYLSVPHSVRHSLSLVIGSFLLYYIVGSSIIWTIGLSSGAYIQLALLSFTTKKCRGVLVSTSVIIFLLLSEFYVINPKMWQNIRGIQMITSMKIISVAIDLDRNLFKTLLNPIEYGGYIFCPANCILGPWISFNSYNQFLSVRFLCTRWITIILKNLGLAVIFLLLSNCIVPWLIMDNLAKWIVAYRDAQAFRMSHYFVSYLSIVSMVSAGFGLTNDCHPDIQITRPLSIELPRSLVQVVVCWNIPMHQWLKNYVFKSCQQYGQFIAILVTYAVSSLLHGWNFQLSAVLLSIGTFSYVEYNFRNKIAIALEVCSLANPCSKQCDHRYKKNSLLAVAFNTIFSFITVIHLAYLGVMFEASFALQETGYSFYHTLSKWENLDYFSHTFAGVMYVIYLMM